jgi:hypothetical protein
LNDTQFCGLLSKPVKQKYFSLIASLRRQNLAAILSFSSEREIAFTNPDTRPLLRRAAAPSSKFTLLQNSPGRVLATCRRLKESMDRACDAVKIKPQQMRIWQEKSVLTTKTPRREACSAARLESHRIRQESRRPRSPDAEAHPRRSPRQTTALRRITSLYHSALSFGMRFSVEKST